MMKERKESIKIEDQQKRKRMQRRNSKCSRKFDIIGTPGGKFPALMEPKGPEKFGSCF
jgi:hypothetical protein